MIEIDTMAISNHCRITTRPNNSISPHGALLLVVVLGLMSLTIALGFTHIGAWPVFMFTLATIIGISIAFQQSLQQAMNYECITIANDKVYVEIHHDNHPQTHEFNIYWVQVVVHYLPGGQCRNFALRSHGKEVTLGHHLNSNECMNLAKLLHARLNTARLQPAT